MSAAATAKHFLGDGGTAFGSSTTDDYLIDQGVTEADDATLRAVHLPPYEAAIEAGARIVMASFSSTSAGKVHGDHHLLTDVLKGELGFSGFVVSDWGGVDQVDPDYATARREVDQRRHRHGDGPVRTGRASRRPCKPGSRRAAIEPSRIDDAVSRILRVKFEIGPVRAPDAARGTDGGGRLGGGSGACPHGRRRVARPAQDGDGALPHPCPATVSC